MQNKLKTAIVHEWLVNYAGSERVVESFTNIWNEADIFTLVDFLNQQERDTIVKGKFPQTSFIQKLPFAKKHHRIVENLLQAPKRLRLFYHVLFLE